MSEISSEQKFLIVITGPTAVGKTSISLKIAKRYKAEILSADSRQIFKEINIGTATPNDKELEDVPHHFVNFCELDQYFSAGRFESAGIQKLEEIYKHSNFAILAGGTGLYIKAILHGLDEIPAVNPGILNELEKDLEELGLDKLVGELMENDPVYALKADLKNSRRVMRALSVFRNTGKPYSSFLGKRRVERPFTTIPILLIRDKEELHERIERRVDEMFEQGLVDEVSSLREQSDLRSLQTVGYPEVFAMLEGDISKTEARDLIATRTKQYAKRQMTYIRKNFPWPSFHPSEESRIIEYIDSNATNLNPYSLRKLI